MTEYDPLIAHPCEKCGKSIMGKFALCLFCGMEAMTERKETMNDAIATKELLVLIQENGIIRNAATGYLIGRLSDDIQFDSEHLWPHLTETVNSISEVFEKHPEVTAVKVERHTQEQTALAFKVLKESLQLDPEYAWGWHCNIAMMAVDAGCDHKIANDGAARFMRLCFDVDTSELPQFKSLGFIPEEPVSFMADVPESYGGTE